MRTRRWVAAVAGVAGAATAHALDVAGLLPFVHESPDTRGAMSPAATVAWLALAALLAAASSRRPFTAGTAWALVISGVPEILVRHDAGGLLEPAAMAGALLQWLLLLLVIAATAAVAERLTTSPPRLLVLVPPRRACAVVPAVVPASIVLTGRRPRAPPSPASPGHLPLREDGPCFDISGVASSRPPSSFPCSSR